LSDALSLRRIFARRALPTESRNELSLDRQKANFAAEEAADTDAVVSRAGGIGAVIPPNGKNNRLSAAG